MSRELSSGSLLEIDASFLEGYCRESGKLFKIGAKVSIYPNIWRNNSIFGLTFKKVKILVHISFWQNQKNICINSTHTKEILLRTLEISEEKVNSP